mmetsp:Transcript_17463/g.46049  ORF Transcript_17463/g.46049 Transcript_17463/m.46049 type:complete len:262 (-) Transcript_17463:153-938(-)
MRTTSQPSNANNNPFKAASGVSEAQGRSDVRASVAATCGEGSSPSTKNATGMPPSKSMATSACTGADCVRQRSKGSKPARRNALWRRNDVVGRSTPRLTVALGNRSEGNRGEVEVPWLLPAGSTAALPSIEVPCASWTLCSVTAAWSEAAALPAPGSAPSSGLNCSKLRLRNAAMPRSISAWPGCSGASKPAKRFPAAPSSLEILLSACTCAGRAPRDAAGVSRSATITSSHNAPPSVSSPAPGATWRSLRIPGTATATKP